MERKLGLDKKSLEDSRHVDVVLGTALHVSVLPVAQHRGLSLFPRDLPLEVGLVAHHHHWHLLAPLKVNQVPQSGHLIKTIYIIDTIHQEDCIRRGERTFQHGRELVNIAPPCVLDVQVQLDTLDVKLAMVHFIHRLLVARDEAVVEELRDDPRLTNLARITFRTKS